MNKDIAILQLFEEDLIIDFIYKEFDLFRKEANLNENKFYLINENLHLTDNTNIAFKAHKKLIENLINYFCLNKYQISFLPINDFVEEEIFNEINFKNIPNLIEELHIKFLNSKFLFTKGNIFTDRRLIRTKSKHYLREYGAVYTLKTITNEIVSNTISNALNNANLTNLKCLDFASGTGRFYFEAIEILKNKYSLTLKDIVCNHLYAIDIDEIALNILKCKVISLFDKIDNEILLTISKNILHRNALIPNTSLLSNSNISFDFSTDFKDVLKDGGFSAIFSNPPYYLLKVNNKNSSILNGHFSKLKNKIKSEIQYFKTSGVYNYSIEGMLNYYQLSIEMIIKLTKENGEIGIICPSSLFADLTSSKLRRFLLNNNTLRFIRYYPESSNLFDNVAQSTIIFYLKKGGVSDKIEIEYNNERFKISLKTINKIFSKNQEIPLIDEVGWSILSKLSNHKKLKDYNFLRNKRGELDLTQYKDCILKGTKTDYRLVRGNMITPNGIVNKNDEFVSIEKFIKRKSKDFIQYDLNKPRLICQQISNVDLRKRLRFTFSKPKDILANSCNYINSLRSIEDLEKLYVLLNSDLLNWRFKVTSSNNHINNYEIDELPIIDLDNLDLKIFNGSNYEKEVVICKLYGLNEIEINYILNDIPNHKLNEKKYLMKLYNHISPKLSDLEWEMAKHIPPGGNWKDIPTHIPSKRLEQIRRSGGRTTYYGRLRYDKPSYTITTYFNRLGNSSNLHPEQQRMISIREGARLQSFKDSFIFYGSKSSQYKQIGNAVPPLLARAVAETIYPYIKNKSIIDLFSGAGGMSEGFIMEGFNVIAANEIEKHFFETYKKNHSTIDNYNSLVLGDITDSTIKEKIIYSRNKVSNVGLVIGGPPCQGFSYAGWRDPNDKRNQLFRDFVDIIKKVRPEGFIMENVPGILTMRKGEVIKEMITIFEEIGYYVNIPFMLKAEEYGVPQKRKRVFIVGTLNNVEIPPPKTLFSIEDENLPNPITVREAIGGLPKIETDSGAFEVECEYKSTSLYESLMMGEIDFKEFYTRCLKALPVSFSNA